MNSKISNERVTGLYLKPAIKPFSNTLTCHFTFDEAKKNKTAQIKKPMWWPVNSAARFLQIIENDNTAHPQPVC